MHPRGVGEEPALAVEDDGVVLPAVPMAEHHLDELVGAIVAGVVPGMGLAAEVRRLGVVERGDDVPRGAAAEHVVEGGEGPRDVEGLVVGRRVRAAQPKAPGRQAHGGQERDQVQLHDADAVADGLGEVVAVAVGHGEPIVEEGQVEARVLEGARDALEVPGREEVRGGLGVAPGGGIVRAVLGLEEGHEHHLPPSCCAHSQMAGRCVALTRCPSSRARRGRPA